MTRRDIDPDVTRHNDAPYWGAVLAMALRDRHTARAAKARKALQRLGILMTARPARKGVTDVR